MWQKSRFHQPLSISTVCPLHGEAGRGQPAPQEGIQAHLTPELQPQALCTPNFL